METNSRSYFEDAATTQRRDNQTFGWSRLSKRLLQLFLCLTLTLIFIPTFTSAEASTGGHSRDEAVQWARDQVGVPYGECPIFVAHYYQYLGQPYPYCDIAADFLNGSSLYVPNGWSYQSNPEPGDVVVWDRYVQANPGWTTDQHGHIGVVIEVQGSNILTVESNISSDNAEYSNPANRPISGVTKFIRPDFNGSNPGESTSTTHEITMLSQGWGTYYCEVNGIRVASHEVNGYPVINAEAGAEVTFVAFPDEGKEVDYAMARTLWGSASGQRNLDVNGMQFTMPDEDVEVLVFFQNAGLPIDEAHFPDAAFRQYIRETFDTYNGGNGYLNEKEIRDATLISIYDKPEITSFSGLEYFSYLQYFDVHQTSIVSLDVSHNPLLIEIRASRNANLRTVNLGSNNNLSIVHFPTSPLIELDVRGCPILLDLVLNGERRIESGTEFYYYSDDYSVDISVLPGTKIVTGEDTPEDPPVSDYIFPEYRFYGTPEELKVPVGESFTLTVDTSGTGLSYRWFYFTPAHDGSHEIDNPQNTLVLNSDANWDGCEFYCSVYDGTGRVVFTNPLHFTAVYKHTLQEGETLSEIISGYGLDTKYGLPATKILSNILDWSTIGAGTDLLLPVSDDGAKRIISGLPDPDSLIDCGQCGDNIFWRLTTDGAIEIYGSGSMYDYTLTDSAPWYTHRTSITSVIINEGITHIGNSAFSFCANMKRATIPYGVTDIGTAAFSYCSNLEQLYLPPVTLNSIGNQAFYNCSNLPEIVFPESITQVGIQAFAGCEKLSDVTIPENLITLGSSPFERCYNMESITVAEGNASFCSIDGVLFSKDKTKIIAFPCGRGGTYNIPDFVTIIGNSAFKNCENLTSIQLPTSIENIGDYAFEDCTSLTTISLNNGPKTIGYWALSGCTSLENLVIPSSVETIKWGAFYCCRSLKSITLPSSLLSIESSAFGYDSMLSDVYYDGTQAQWNAIEIAGYFNEPLLNATIHFNTDIAINETNFPDPVFRAYIAETFDANGDGYLNEVERSGVTEIDCNCPTGGAQIETLQGLEFFPKLETLSCVGNLALADLDLSGNPSLMSLNCRWCYLSTLNITNNSRLKYVICEENLLKSLDISNCIALEELNCGYNRIENLDVSHNTALRYLYCYNNALQVLDTSHNLELEVLNTMNCSHLSAFDVSQNTKLRELTCSEDALTSLDVSHNLELTVLSCGYNHLGTLDVSNNTALTDLACYNDDLSELDISNNPALRCLMCPGNNLSTLNILANSAIQEIYFRPTGVQDRGDHTMYWNGDDCFLVDKITRIIASDAASTLTLPAFLSSIEASAFSGVNAQTIVIPASVGVIGAKAFADCKSLEVLYFEGSPNEIADDAITGCNNVVVSVPRNSSAAIWANKLGLAVIYH